MANRRIEFLIGMTVVVIFIAVTVMTILFVPETGLFVRRGGKRMTITFEKANGITNNSKIYKSGIAIGRVYSRELKDDSLQGHVEVQFELDPGTKIYSNEQARIISGNLLGGDSGIEFVKISEYKGEVLELQEGDVIIGRPGGNILNTVNNIEGDLTLTLKRMTDAATGLSAFMDNLNNFLGSPEELADKKMRLQEIFTELKETLTTVNGLAKNVNDIAADETVKNGIRQSAERVPEILEKSNTFMTNANTLTDDFRITINRVHSSLEQIDRNLDNVGKFTDSLADSGTDFIESLADSSRDLQKMVQNIGELAEGLNKQINDPESTLAVLADPKIASSIRGIIQNTETISMKLEPVVDDARVFTNKIAHRPSSLIFSKESFKGTPSTARNNSGLQSKTPQMGVNSPLFRPGFGAPVGSTLQYTPGGTDLEMLPPDSLTAYYNRFPQEAEKAQQKESSCFWKRWQFSLFTSPKESDQPAATATPYPTYSMSLSGIPGEGNSFFMNSQGGEMNIDEEDAWYPSPLVPTHSASFSPAYSESFMPTGLTYSPGEPSMIPPVANPQATSKTTAAGQSGSGRMKFSLGSVSRLFHGKKSEPVAMNNQATETPTGSGGYPGGYSPDTMSMPWGNDLAIPPTAWNGNQGMVADSSPSMTGNRADDIRFHPVLGEQEPLFVAPGIDSSGTRQVMQTRAAAQRPVQPILPGPEQSRFSDSAFNVDQFALDNSKTEALPASINRPANRERNFVDDGLPIQPVPGR